MPLPPLVGDEALGTQSAPEYFQEMDLDTQQANKNKNKALREARDLTIKGKVADEDQRANMELVITTASEVKNSSKRSVIAAICAVIQENLARNEKKGDSTSTGMFQVLTSTALDKGVDPMDIEACTKQFMTGGWTGAGGAITVARKNPNFSPGKIAFTVQGPRSDQLPYYVKWEEEAEKWYESAEGGRIGATVDTTYRKQYQYKREKNENSWDCMQRLAEEVKWRCFPVGRVLYYMSEIDLFRRRVLYTVTPEDQSVIDLEYDIDWRAKVPANEATLTVNLERWGAPPGYPIRLDGFGPPDGRWLIISVKRDWFSPIAEVTLRQPAAPVKEEASELATRSTTGAEADGTGMKLYKECRRIHRAGSTYVYGGGHGVPLSSLRSGQGLDCSSSTSLALYRAGFWDHRATARVSGEFKDWGRGGRGNIFTVCYNGGHVYIRFEPSLSVDAQRFDTSSWSGDKNSQRGPRLRSSQGPPNDTGYGLRHWPEM